MEKEQREDGTEDMIGWWLALMVLGGYALAVASFLITLFSSRGDLEDAFLAAALVFWVWVVGVFWISPMEVTW